MCFYSSTMHGRLYLIRHGQSEWNAYGLWTGQVDSILSIKGHEQARTMGRALQDVTFTYAYTSFLCRAQQTLHDLLATQGQTSLSGASIEAFNERDYGDYTSKNKQKMKEILGPEKYLQIIKDWDEPIPGGETLKETSARVIAAYQKFLLPKLQRGHTVLLVSHCHVMRVLVKHLEDISNEDFGHLDLDWNKAYVYPISPEGHVGILHQHSLVPTLAKNQ